ncbi:MAG TPA: hypothetical protein VNU68_33290 [Verrucomicrobiae bacterium]|nr:hypothetical protein [Verrucomicrobiae bacterium]
MLSRASLILNGVGGTPGGAYRILSSIDLARPRSNWIEVASGTMDGNGNFFVNVPVNDSDPLRFYLVAAP